MKAAFVTEFYLRKRKNLPALALSFVLLAFAYFSGAVSASPFLLCIPFAFSCFAFSNEEKNMWNEFSAALPVKSFYRVTARFVFSLAEIWLVCVVVWLVMRYPFKTEGAYYYGVDLWFVNALCFFTVAQALLNFVDYRIKHDIKNSVKVLLYIPVVAFHILFSGRILRDYSMVASMFEAEKWLLAVEAVCAVMLTAALWALSAKAASKRNNQKRLRAVCCCLICVAVAAVGVSLGIIYKDGWFEKQEVSGTQYYNYGDGKDHSFLNRTQKANIQQMRALMSEFCTQQNIGRSMDECTPALKKLGFYEAVQGSNTFVSKTGKVSVEFICGSGGTVKAVEITGDVGENYREKMTTEEVYDIELAFPQGLKETQMLEKLKEMNLYPNSVKEEEKTDGIPMRTYIADCYVEEFDDIGVKKLRYVISSANGTVIKIEHSDITFDSEEEDGMGFFDKLKSKKNVQLSQEAENWNKMMDCWSEGKLNSPYDELVGYYGEVSGDGHGFYFTNLDSNGDTEKTVNTLKENLPEALGKNLAKAYELYVQLENETDDSKAEKIDKELYQCDVFFSENIATLEQMLQQYADKL